MGFLEDLIKTIQEAAEEARQDQRQQRRSGDYTRASEPAERQQARVVRRHREESHAEHPPAPLPLPVHAAPREESAPPPAPVHRPPATSTDRLARLLRQPRTVMEGLLLAEILAPPLAYRRGLLRQPTRRPGF